MDTRSPLLHYFILFYCIYLEIYVCGCVCIHAHHSAHVESGDNIQDFVLLFPHVRPQMVAVKPGVNLTGTTFIFSGVHVSMFFFVS